MWPPKEGMPSGRPRMIDSKMLAGSPPYFQRESMSAGPMPPPPFEWQPLQLYQRKRRLPCAISKAFLPSKFRDAAVSVGPSPGWPGWMPPMRGFEGGEGAADGDFEKMRASRSQP